MARAAAPGAAWRVTYSRRRLCRARPAISVCSRPSTTLSAGPQRDVDILAHVCSRGFSLAMVIMIGSIEEAAAADVLRAGADERTFTICRWPLRASHFQSSAEREHRSVDDRFQTGVACWPTVAARHSFATGLPDERTARLPRRYFIRLALRRPTWTRRRATRGFRRETAHRRSGSTVWPRDRTRRPGQCAFQVFRFPRS